ncbi:MAG: restriction endonuclease subunit S [Candidatus Heimdallarchaeota archaeon]|nr:restriction endonuclease subunit S [Candidatus Heimdallarchaeota archaeon]
MNRLQLLKNKHQLRNDWIITTFGDKRYFHILGSGISKFEGKKDYLSTSSVQNGAITNVESQITFINRPSRANMEVKENSIWFAKMKNTLKFLVDTKYLRENAVLSTGFAGLKILHGSKLYFYFFISTRYFNDQKDLRCYGTTQEAINSNGIKNIPVFFPKNPNQQEIIAQILFDIDQSINDTKVLIKKTKKIKMGLLQFLYNNNSKELMISRYTKADKNWKICKLNDLSDIVSGFTKNSKSKVSDGIKVPYMTVKNVKNAHFDLSDVSIVNVSESDFQKYQLKKDDILMTEGGDPDKLGRGSIWNNEIQPCIHQNHIFRVRCNENYILPRFLHYYLQTYYAKKYFFLNSKQTSNLASINMSDLKNFPVPLPEIDVQKSIIDKIEVVDQNLKDLHAEVSSLKLLKESLMQKLFTGKIRVNGD